MTSAELVWKAFVFLTKIFILGSLGITALFTFLIGLIPAFQFIWIFTGILALSMFCLINAWWLKLGLFKRTKSLGQQTGAQIAVLPEVIETSATGAIMKRVEGNFTKIARANGLEHDDIFASIIKPSHGLKIRLRSVNILKQNIDCPIDFILIHHNTLKIKSKNITDHNFFHTTTGQSKLLLLSNQIADTLTGTLLHNWLKRLLTNDQNLASTINSLIHQPPVKLVKKFIKANETRPIIRSQFLKSLRDTIIIDGNIIHETDFVTDFDPTDPVRQPCELSLESPEQIFPEDGPEDVLTNLKIEIEEKKLDTKELEEELNEDRLNSGPLDEEDK